MAQITAAMVKDLREKTGAGMMDCKKALAETNGDPKAAADWLREKGIAKAAKKSGRIAAEGAVAAYVSDNGKVAVLIEVNCETDFAAKNENFRKLEKDIAEHIAKTGPKDLDALNASKLGGKTVETLVTEATATIGEKISIRRFVRYESKGKVTSYIHMGGKIGVLVELDGGDDQLGKDIAMQIAASNPSAIDVASLPQEFVDHERAVQLATAKEENAQSNKPKPDAIIEKMVEGRMKKYYKEVCLIEQIFVKDTEKTVKDVLGKVKVLKFDRYQLGEGIEKKQEDFAAEVAAQIKG
ncbi:MAG: elongation factor Ts [Selenomonadaceae bacterium]|nr:elongation factor Ts [Selenomonadaceae bacterium]